MGYIKCIDVVVPWALAALIGAVTATTGLYMSINCDFLSDLRFGRCRGLVFSDRNRCCGGADNINYATGRCKEPTLVADGSSAAGFANVEWVPWEDVLPVPFLVYITASVLYSVLAALLVHEYSPPARGSGIPDVKAAVSGFSIASSFSGVCLLVKALTLSLAVSAGLALGKEGPSIHLGVCWAYLLRARGGLLGALTGTVPLHEVVCVGAAAGVSTAFGAPVGGVLFAVEELGSVRTLSQRALLLAFAGSFTASFVVKSWNLYGANQLTFFKLSTSIYNPSKEWLTWEISLFLLLGTVGGLVGSLFIRLNLWVSRRRRRQAEAGKLWFIPSAVQDPIIRRLPRCMLRPDAAAEAAAGMLGRSNSNSGVGGGSDLIGSRGPQPRLSQLTVHVLEVVLLALITAIINYPLTRLLRMPMIEVIHGLFETCPHSLGKNLGLCDASAPHGFATGRSLEVSLLLAAFVRLLQAAVTFGAMVPSGLFIPSLYIGAALGRFVGLRTLDLSLQILGPKRQTQINPSVFAMVGAVAVSSGFGRMTVSLVVIMLELTGELNYAVPFMCAVLVAKLVGDTFTVSIYDGHAALLGFATIEEPKGFRLVPHISDVALPLGEADILDVTEPVPLEVLKAALDGRSLASLAGAGELPDALGRAVLTPPASRSMSSRSVTDSEAALAPSPTAAMPGSVLVLVHGANRSEVRGVVERERLRLWLEASPPPAGALCLFGGPDDTVKGPTVDFRELVETGFRRLLASAPVLTAVCAFREYPELTYCVCRTEVESVMSTSTNSYSILSRERLEKALSEGRFAAAFRTFDGSPGVNAPGA